MPNHRRGVKMSEIRVGMRLRELYPHYAEATVTEITAQGFKYSYDEEMDWIPRWGWRFAKDGHEHYGLGGYSSFELVNPAP